MILRYRKMENKKKITVIKVGGKIVEEPASLAALLDRFTAIEGAKVLIHGGGRSATKIAERLGIESKMVGGRRITDADTLQVVTMVYGGLVNKNIVAGLQARGVNALGLTGADCNIIRAHKRPVGEVDYGFVGDVDYADGAGKKIKLLGRAIRNEDGTVTAYVAPHLVDGSDPLAGVEDVFNAITVKGDAVGDVMFYGRGAGKLPTASAVVADVIDAAKHIHTKKYLDWDAGGDDVCTPPDGLVSAWYVRAAATADAVRSLLPEANFLARHGATAGEVAFLTGGMTRAQLEEKLAGLELLSVLRVLN